MNCEFIVRNEIAERYLLGDLPGAEQEAYERHYFECPRCAQELEQMQTLQEVLQKFPPSPARAKQRPAWAIGGRWFAVPALAASIVGVALILRPRDLNREHAREPVVTTGPTAEAPPATAVPSGSPVAAAPAEPPARAVGDSTSLPRVFDRSREVAAALKRLARVSPPGYRPVVLRGTTDEATVLFHKGMAAYAAGDYRAAVSPLERAAALGPERPDISFYLGVSQLLAGNTAAAIGELRRTVALGDTPLLAEAHFYLAKAHLAGGDVGAARTDLEAVVRLTGGTRTDAVEALAEMDSLDLR